MTKPDIQLYEFNPFHVDARKRLLLRDGEVLPLTPKAFDTLLALIANHGRVMEKDELMQAVWPDTIVEESALSRNIYLLRKALGESPDQHRYIVTVPGRGYRFVASVNQVIEQPIRNESAEVLLATRTRTSIVTEEEETEGLEDREKGRRTPALSPAPRRRVARSLLVAGTVFVALIAAMAYWRFIRRPATATVVRSIAVLPFKPLVGDSNDEYLQLGMADVLITRLSTLRQLVVRPTSAVRKYASPEQDAVAAGRELQVDAVLDGNLQRVGDRVRVTARLVGTGDGVPLWAETFDEKFTDIFRVQDQLSERLADALTASLTGADRQQLTKRQTENPDAFQAYVKGRYFWSRWTEEGLEKAIEYFEQARTIDPNYALAYSGLADSYNLLGYLGIWPPREAFPKSEAMARQALKLDDTLAEAHLSLAKTKFFYDWDWLGFEREMKRALELNPNYADAHSMYGTYFMAMGKSEEAITERKRGLALDPLSPFHHVAVGWSYFYARQYDQAIEWYRRALELDPHYLLAQEDLGTSCYKKGTYDQAIVEMLKAKTLSGTSPETLDALRQAYATAGKTGYWRKELELAEQQLQRGKKVSPWRMARIHTELGDKDQAFVWLGRACDERVSLMPFLKVVPLFESLHADSRFDDLLRRIGLIW